MLPSQRAGVQVNARENHPSVRQKQTRQTSENDKNRMHVRMVNQSGPSNGSSVAASPRMSATVPTRLGGTPTLNELIASNKAMPATKRINCTGPELIDANTITAIMRTKHASLTAGR